MAGIPLAAVLGGVAARHTGEGTDSLFVAAGVSDFVSASASTGGNAHLGAAWRSIDALSWTQVSVPTARILTAVAYGQSRFVAIGEYTGPPPAAGIILASIRLSTNGGAWMSQDGRSWSGVKLPGSGVPTRIVAGATGFLAAALDDADATTWTSSDGVHWSAGAIPGGDVADLIPFADGYLAVGGAPTEACPSGVPVTWTSTDGTTWQQLSHPDLGCGTSMTAVVSGPRGYVATGLVPSATGASFREVSWASMDGRTWTGPALIDVLPSSGDAPSIPILAATDDGYFVAVDDVVWESDAAQRWDKVKLGDGHRVTGPVGRGFVFAGTEAAWFLGPAN